MTEKKRATKREALRLAKALGVEIEEDVDAYGGTIFADAPPGQVFATTGAHGVVETWIWGTKPEAWAELCNEMSEGLEACEEPGCDCREVERPQALAASDR